jgi:cysteine-rich repeat protein
LTSAASTAPTSGTSDPRQHQPPRPAKYDARFDIFEGGVYEIALFQAERQTTQSNYRLTLAGFLNTGTTQCDILCGDGLIRGDEQCDDGNIDSADGCSATPA